MKVHELIAILEDMDPDADVYLMSQESWPFEHSIVGVCQREDFTEADPDADAEAEPPPADGDRWAAPGSSLPMNDVFIVEGRQLRYGSKAAWDVARRW